MEEPSKILLLTKWKRLFFFFVLVSWLLISFYGVRLDQDSLLTDIRGNVILDIPDPVYTDETEDLWLQRRRTFEHSVDSSRLSDLVVDKNDNPTNVNHGEDYNFTTAKKILFFTKYFEKENFGIGFGHEPFVMAGCPVTNCYATSNKSLLSSVNKFDAILFHMRNMLENNLRIPNQSKRKPFQRYVMFLKESPLHDGFNYKRLKDFFNWTMTYRPDSDIPAPYGWIDDKSNPSLNGRTMKEMKSFSWKPFQTDWQPSEELKETVKNKRKKVAWIVSNCHTESQRENYIKELSRYIKVDVMGKCGHTKCSNIGGKDNCTVAVEKHYKFYLSFENSFCKDYVTEKFFLRMDQNVLPVVFGGGNYSAIAPPHSHINALAYDSPEALAKYLHWLDQNDTEYMSYFWWKDFYNVKMRSPICRLCQMLNSDLPPKVHHDLTEWWTKGGKCLNQGKFPWFKQLIGTNDVMKSIKEYAKIFMT